MSSNVRITDEKIKFRGAALAPTSSIRTGGIASSYSQPRSLDEVRRVLAYAREHACPYRAIGALSNTLISDETITEIIIDTRAMTEIRIQNSVLIAQSGATMEAVINAAVDAGLGGLEELAGLPGTVGGAVYGNSGANSKAIVDTLCWVEYLDSNSLLRRSQVHRTEYGYRHSPFVHHPEYIITEAAFALRPLVHPSEARERTEAYKAQRRAKGHFRYPSLGSIFKNPAPDKSAGSLIDALGLKGYRVGGAKVSEEHANFIINPYRTATSTDVATLIAHIKETVEKAYSITLEEEINYLGPWSK